MYKVLQPLYESQGLDYDPEAEKGLTDSEELQEGFKEMIQAARLKKFESRVMRKGSTSVYYVRVRSSGSFGKAVFESDKMTEVTRFDTMDEMEADIGILQAEGYQIVKEAGFKSFVRLVIRNLGRMKQFLGVTAFVIASMLILAAIVSGGAALGGLAAIVGLEVAMSGTIAYGIGWMMATVAPSRNALRDERGTGTEDAVRARLSENQTLDISDKETMEASIRDMVRATIKDKTREVINGEQKPA